MAYNSFYGGPQGYSFIIVKSYLSIADMARDFKKGPDYSAVHFNEHVLINTENKNDPDNGKIFRRGYDYTNDLGGAVYIGTIVGPAGKSPMVEMTTIEEVKNLQKEEGYTYRYTEGSYNPTVNLIPGKVSDTEFNDEIQWACCSVRNKNNEDTTAYIGFIFPYLVTEYTAQSVSPYFHRSDNTEGFVNQNLITRTDDRSHPYFEKFHIDIPKGLKGDTFKNFRVAPASSIIEDYNGKQDDIAHNREVLIYDYYHYDKEEGGEPVTIYLGDYNMIDSINFDEEGTVVIDYSHDDDLVYTKLFKWVKEVTLDGKTGHFTVKYNHSTDKNDNPTIYETDLSWVDSISLAHDGTVTLHWTTGETEDLSETLRWIDEIVMKADGTVIVNYNDSTNDTFDNKIQWIDKISLLEDGTFTVKYNNGTPDYVAYLKWVKDINIDNDGTVHIIYNREDPLVYNKMIKYLDHIYFDETQNKFHAVYNTGDDEVVDNIIKFIKDVYINDSNEDPEDNDYKLHIVYNTDEDKAVGQPIKFLDDVYIDDDENTNPNADFKFHLTYNTGEIKAVGNPTNYLLESVIDPKDYHYLIYYSNANIRKELESAGRTRTYNGKDGWLDLGSLRDDDGVLIGFNILPDSIPGIESITFAINYLNSVYPEGLTDPKVYGKIVTVGEPHENKNFYAFDYTYDENDQYKGWYYLGTFADERIWTLVGKENDIELNKDKNKVAIGGVWFIVEDTDD